MRRSGVISDTPTLLLQDNRCFCLTRCKFQDRDAHTIKPSVFMAGFCPECGYMDETSIDSVKSGCAVFTCRRCERAHKLPFSQIKGKLNWKLDCAARWAIFHVDAEPFTKAYLEPKAGTFTVAQALSQTFFGGAEILPLLPLSYLSLLEHLLELCVATTPKTERIPLRLAA